MTAPVSMREGYGVYGTPFMKFTLTYDGPLPASANRPKNIEKWEIRKAIEPQLRDLWRSHPALVEVEENRHFPTGGAPLIQNHHLYPGPIQPLVTIEGKRKIIDLCEPILRHGCWFRPLIRESFALHCGLKIIFLRQEPPGKIYQGGDLDGRIKTIVDALAMPQHAEQMVEKGSTAQSPIYCLLEDDAMLSGLQVESERLLNAHHNAADHVRLNIEVDVRVRRATIYNQSFLG